MNLSSFLSLYSHTPMIFVSLLFSFSFVVQILEHVFLKTIL
uniref:Uncharacterized protein n=1 Tax=Rhizophora mucronata TaxID=61149 RepID=A0A2P2P6H1_RHIMU